MLPIRYYLDCSVISGQTHHTCTRMHKLMQSLFLFLLLLSGYIPALLYLLLLPTKADQSTRADLQLTALDNQRRRSQHLLSCVFCTATQLNWSSYYSHIRSLWQPILRPARA